MKFKVKFDKRAIQDFLLQNVEKIVLATVACVFLLLLYSALTKAARFDKSPDDLQRDVARGETTIKETPATSDLVVEDYVSQVKRSRVSIEEKPYSTVVLWDKPLFERRPLRPAPPLFTVQQLRATAGAGAFRDTSTAGAGGEGVRGKRWVVLTALVPFEKQKEAYAEAFKAAVDYNAQRDQPIYDRYSVERLEVASAGEAANPNWDKATKFTSSTEIDKVQKQWPQQSKAIDGVAPQYVETPLVFPLGPLTGRDWDASVAHDPEIPFSKATGRDITPIGRSPRGRGGELPADDRQLNPGRGGESPVADQTTPYKLFRFFDFSAQPGKQYLYRVCLELSNPNKGLKSAALKSPELANDTLLKTKWSEPTGVISVPRDTRILLLAVNRALRGSSEPSGRILVTKWILKNGAEVSDEFAVTRGQVANFSGGTLKADFLSGATAVDFRGGERLVSLPSRKVGILTSPGELLLLNADGTLTVRNELDDTPAYEQITRAPTEPAAGDAGSRPEPTTGGGRGRRGLEAIDPEAEPARGGRR
jgi:hypothetical protein